MLYRGLCVTWTLLVCACSVWAQYPPAAARDDFANASTSTVPDQTHSLLKKQVNEVNLVLTVTDRKGHFKNGLTADNFSIFDNNTQQREITFFQHQTDLPLDIAIVLDTSQSVNAEYESERNSITQFLRQTIRPDDSAVLFAFNDAIRVIAPIHYNWRDLSHRLKRITPQGNTALYDAVSKAAERLSENVRPARRIIIVVSDGQENKSAASQDQALAAVLKAGAVVYSVNNGDDPSTPYGEQGETVLKTLSQSTGGKYFFASMDGDLGTVFSKIHKELRSQYVLAYKPSQLASSEFHILRVVVGNLIVRCRRGYYAR